MKHLFEMTVTDTFGGDPNYCWARRYNVFATSMRGAITILNAHEQFSRLVLDYSDGDSARWNVQGACICILGQFTENPNLDHKTLPHHPVYEVIVGNVGRIYHGYDRAEALKAYKAGVNDLGRSDGSATILKDGEIWKETP